MASRFHAFNDVWFRCVAGDVAGTWPAAYQRGNSLRVSLRVARTPGLSDDLGRRRGRTAMAFFFRQTRTWRYWVVGITIPAADFGNTKSTGTGGVSFYATPGVDNVDTEIH